MTVRWYVAYKLSYRDIDELFFERGVHVDLATLHRWVFEYAPLLEAVFVTAKSTQCLARGEWMKRISKLKVCGFTCTEPSINTAILSIKC